jgi:hypothetical protein
MALVFVGMIGFAFGPSEASAANRGTSYRGGPVGRAFATRLYYSNAFRGLIPGTGYGGFRRPAFGYRGY